MAETILLDQFSFATTPIEIRYNKVPLGIGTAFFWKENGKDFLITNWHNLSGRNAETKELIKDISPNNVVVFPITRKNPSVRIGIAVAIRDESDFPLWFVHPDFKTEVDIVALPISVGSDVSVFPINEMPNELLLLKIGMDVFILGYPFGIDNCYPIWKRGSIATEPNLVGIDRQFMLVDSASRPGMSGSPVIRRSWNNATFENGGISIGPGDFTRLVGVYSGRLNTKNPLDAQLGMVWPIGLVSEIIAGAHIDR